MIGDAVQRLRQIVAAFSAWVRVDYPKQLPRPGHVALVALCGQDRRLLEQTPQSMT